MRIIRSEDWAASHLSRKGDTDFSVVRLRG
jgi:hypothetical protein